MTFGQKMSLISLTAILAISALILGSSWWWRVATTRTRILQIDARESFERDAAQHMPRGSTKAEVRRYLEARKMVYTDYVEPGQPAAQSASEIEARTTEAIKTPLGSCFILAKFEFDANNALDKTSYNTTCKGFFP